MDPSSSAAEGGGGGGRDGLSRAALGGPPSVTTLPIRGCRDAERATGCTAFPSSSAACKLAQH